MAMAITSAFNVIQNSSCTLRTTIPNRFHTMFSSKIHELSPTVLVVTAANERLLPTFHTPCCLFIIFRSICNIQEKLFIQ